MKLRLHYTILGREKLSDRLSASVNRLSEPSTETRLPLGRLGQYPIFCGLGSRLSNHSPGLWRSRLGIFVLMESTQVTRTCWSGSTLNLLMQQPLSYMTSFSTSVTIPTSIR